MINDIGFALDNFIQLIQLWAGICLLFFYQPFFKKYPFRKRLDSLAETIDNIFYNKYQPTVPDTEFPGYPTVDWDGYLKNIKNMAALTFFYCIFLLFYIGYKISNPEFFSIRHTSFLSFANYAIILYLIFCLFNLKIFHTYWTPFIYILLLFIVFFNYEDIDKSHFSFLRQFVIDDKPTLIMATLSTCLTGVVILGFRLAIDYFLIRFQEDQLNNLDEEVSDVFNEYMKRSNNSDTNFDQFRYQNYKIELLFDSYLSTKFLKFEQIRKINREDDELSVKREEQLQKLIDERLNNAFKKHEDSKIIIQIKDSDKSE